MREYIVQTWESGNRRVFQYLSLFSFLVVIYSIYLASHLRVLHFGADSFPKLCFTSALPFAALAYSDETWCSNDAAPVCVAAWVAVCVVLSFLCKVCALGVATVFFPFVASALLAHGFGTLCRFAKDRIHLS